MTVVEPRIAAALGLSPAATLTPAPQGMTSEVAFVDDGSLRAVVKRCRDPIYVEWLRREHRVLVALESTAVPAPRPLAHYEVGANDGLDEVWLLMTRLPGEPLWHVLQEVGAADRRRHLRTLGALLRRLHTTAPPASFRRARPWIDRMLAAARANLAWCDGSAALLAELDAARPAPQAETLIHGDLALDNVLVDANGAMRLIDWSGGDIGDPRYDIALALATEPELALSAADGAAFFDGYGAAPPDAGTLRWFRNLYEFF